MEGTEHGAESGGGSGCRGGGGGGRRGLRRSRLNQGEALCKYDFINRPLIWIVVIDRDPKQGVLWKYRA
jgi:hypothetical protein